MIDDFLSLNIPVETGPINFTFLNDSEAAKGYIYHARKLLAATKQYYGVYDRVAAGQPGGFFRHGVDLSDGTRITVYTNDGVDVAVISTVTRVPKKEEKEEEFEHELQIGKDFYIGVQYVSGGKPLPTPPELKFDGPNGIEGFYEKRWVFPHLCVWVPEKKSVDSDERLIVSNRNSILGVDVEDGDEFYLGGDITRPHLDDIKQFPIGLFKSSSWVVEEGVDRYGAYWDVLITHKSIPPPGVYDVKVCSVGSDCAVLEPAKYKVVASFGFTQVSKEVDIVDFTTTTRLLMPRGFYWKSSNGDSSKADWYRNLDTTSDPLFGNQTNNIFAAGHNPHGDNWWQGGITGLFDHEPIRRKNKSFLSVVEPENNDGRPFLVDGAFDVEGVADYSDPGNPLNPNDHYYFIGPYTGYPPKIDRCTDFMNSSSKRIWGILRLGLAGQNVAYSARRRGEHRCVTAYPNENPSDLGILVFMNLGSPNENDFIVDIPGVAVGTRVTFFSPHSGRTIFATVERIQGSGLFLIGSKSLSCAYATLEVTENVQSSSAYNADTVAVGSDFFFVSVVHTHRDVSLGPPYYLLTSEDTYTLDSGFTLTPLDESEAAANPFFEGGPYDGQETAGWEAVLEKHWANGK